MNEELEQLLNDFDLSKRGDILQKIYIYLRKITRERIKNQVTPSGDKFAPRSKPRKKRPTKRDFIMFKRLRLAKHFKKKFTKENFKVGFFGGIGWLAAQHHNGGWRKIQNNITAFYPARPLLGITDEDLKQIEKIILDNL